MQQTVIGLLEQGWPQRRIARELGIDRETVARYRRLRAELSPNSAISAPGSDPSRPPKPAISTPGSAGRRSLCQGLTASIQAKLEQGLSAKRIYQDLTQEQGFTGSYQSVKRFVRQLENRSPLPYRRMECEPGAEVQVDFGRAAPVTPADGPRRVPHLFRVVLSHSRKAYSEVVWRQTTETFIRALENAFRYFGGVPRTVVIDNLKAAVARADWYDPELNPKVRSFAEHYGTAILPTRPYTPRHKGKVERAIGYVQSNALKGRTFGSLAEQNQYLRHWEQTVADTRVHGTTKRQVRDAFQQERGTLGALPPSLFACFQEGQRTVNRDGHVEVSRAYYSVPVEYRARQVWVRWDARMVWIYNQRFEQIAVHGRRPDGQFSSLSQHVAPEKISIIERGTDWMLRRAAQVGPHCEAWAKAVLANRGIQGIRALQGLLSLTGRHRATHLDNACRQALAHERFHLREVRSLLAAPGADPGQFAFLDRHPLIRPLEAYDALAVFPDTQEEGVPS
jgi:transposase